MGVDLRPLYFDPTNMADAQDFEFQLRAQQEFRATQQPQQVYPGASGSGTYVDPSDGTVYEWDQQRKGWFPKVPTTITNLPCGTFEVHPFVG